MVAISLIVSSAFYSTTFSRSTHDLIESQAREINKQIILNYENYIMGVIDTANYLQHNLLERDVLNDQEIIKQVLSYSIDINRDVVSITLYDQEGFELIGAGSHSSDQDMFWAMRSLNDDSIFHFSPPHTQENLPHNNDLVISIARTATYLKEGQEAKGILLINLNFNSIEELSAQTNLGEGGHLLILGERNSLIYSTLPVNSPDYKKSYELARDHYFGGSRVSIRSREMYLNTNTLIHTRWRIITISNINDLALAKDRNLKLLVVLFFVSLLASLGAGAYISQRISRPLYQLEKAMFRIEEGDFFTPVELSGQKEVVHLASAFNKMLQRIRTLMDEVVSEQRGKRKNELAALQNQINPHFLYNTLDSIVWLAENNRNKDVVTTVVALARFFRISISRGENYIPVKDEIAHVENYLTIQQIRYVDKFEYRLEISQQVYDHRVMKLILQPLVENAIYHGGGEGDDEKGIITIRSYLEGDKLCFEVENTGYGITDERIRQISQAIRNPHATQGVGLRNVFQRLKLYYGEGADLVISSELDEMTRVSLYIPLEVNDET